MQTDPVSAAHAYRAALEAILEAKSLTGAQHRAQQALEITIAKAEASSISVSSGYGANTQTPYVALALTTPVVQLLADQAREIGVQLIEAAEAARMDGFVVRFVREELDGNDQTAAMMLGVFRGYRKEDES